MPKARKKILLLSRIKIYLDNQIQQKLKIIAIDNFCLLKIFIYFSIFQQVLFEQFILMELTSDNRLSVEHMESSPTLVCVHPIKHSLFAFDSGHSLVLKSSSSQSAQIQSVVTSSNPTFTLGEIIYLNFTVDGSYLLSVWTQYQKASNQEDIPASLLIQVNEPVTLQVLSQIEVPLVDPVNKSLVIRSALDKLNVQPLYKYERGTLIKEIQWFISVEYEKAIQLLEKDGKAQESTGVFGYFTTIFQIGELISLQNSIKILSRDSYLTIPVSLASANSFATFEGNGFARFWTEEKGKLFLDHKLDVTKVPVSQATVVTGPKGEPIVIYMAKPNHGIISTLNLDLKSSPHGKIKITDDAEEVTHLMSLSPISQYFLAATSKCDIHLFDIVQGDIVQTLSKANLLSNLSMGKNWKEEVKKRALEIKEIQGIDVNEGRFIAVCKEEVGFMQYNVVDLNKEGIVKC